MTQELSDYISKRYNRWLDYSKYHCTLNGMKDEAGDVLNEVMDSLLRKDENELNRLFCKKQGQYRELDYYVLRMIKLNVTSDFAPYKWKYPKLPIDAHKEFSTIITYAGETEDPEYDEIDIPGKILMMTNKVRYIFENLEIPELSRRIFEYRFFQNEKFSDWPGPECNTTLYSEFNYVKDIIKKKIANH